MTAHRLLEPTARLTAAPQHADMVHVSGGTFRMGSDRHYREEAPAHRVTVDGFWIDRAPVTNAQFRRFVEETGHVTFAELPPKPEDYPGAMPHMLRAGSLVFSPPEHLVSLADCSQWWTYRFGACWRKPYGPGSSIRGLDDHPVVHVTHLDAEAYARWPVRHCRPRPNGSSPRAAALRMPNSPGVTSSCRAGARWRTPGRASSRTRTSRHRLQTHDAGRQLPAERLRASRYDRQCLGMDDRLVFAEARGRRAEGLLHPREPARRQAGRELRPTTTGGEDSSEGGQGRVAPLRAKLLPTVPPRRASRPARRHVDEPYRVPVCCAEQATSNGRTSEPTLPVRPPRRKQPAFPSVPRTAR